ncbi:terpene synthase family protein [Streptomyces sp. NPDC055107]
MTTLSETEALPAELLTFYCPLTPETSPEADQLQHNALAWAQKYDLGAGDDRRTAKYALTAAAWSANGTPHARGQVAQALCDYNAWAWVANDLVNSGRPTCEIVAAFGRWERIIRSPRSWPAAVGLDAALADAFSRLRTHLTPLQWERFVAGQSQWLLAMSWEAAQRETGTRDNVNDYLAQRFSAGGCYSAAAYIDAVENIELDEHQWARPDVRAAAEAAMLTALLDNDRYSLIKDLKKPVRSRNLFDALQHEHPGTSLAEAVVRGVALRDRVMSRYLQLRGDILTSASGDLVRYMGGLDLIISGNISFAATAVRYLLPDSAHTVTTTDRPADDGTGELACPTIAWWWEPYTP